MSPPRWLAVCRKCGRTFTVSDRDTLKFLDTGWPTCCGTDMKVMYYPNGVPRPDSEVKSEPAIGSKGD